MPNAEEKTITVALNCAVKVSGALYSKNDVIHIPEDIARRLVEQGAADLYEIPVEDFAAPEIEEAAHPEEAGVEAVCENLDSKDETSEGSTNEPLAESAIPPKGRGRKPKGGEA